jgi:hypothetical protein
MRALRKAVADLVIKGVYEEKRSSPASGPMLDWSRLDLRKRQEEMKTVLNASLQQRANSRVEGEHIFVEVSGREVLFKTHAIASAMGVPAAREMVGQPFLYDYRFGPVLTGKLAGPVHFIACHRNVTEHQAMNQLGFPDATIVSPGFGVYVADNIQKIQMVFLANCKDESSTRHAVARFFTWMEEEREDILFSKRAFARSKIVKEMAANL